MRWGWYMALIVAALLVAPSAQAAFPGENGKLVFTSRVESPNPEYTGPPQVFTVNPDGSDLTRLTFSGVDESPGVFSTDGTRIAFSRLAEAPVFNDVWVMNSDGTGQTRLPGLPNEPDYPSDWSPDGSRIYFGGDGGVWSMLAADGSDKVLHANSGASEGAGTPSPDGERIAFLSSFDTFGGITSDVYTVKLDGTEDWVRLTNNRFEELSPDYSPDGSRIAFASARDGDWDVYTMNPDGSGVFQVTNNSLHEPAVTWSPDGKRLAFLSDREGANQYKLFVANADGTGQTKVSDIVVEWGVDWQPLQNRPPDCSALTAQPPAFERSDRRLHIVTVGGATDPDGDSVELEVTGVTQDEPVMGPGDHTRPDARLLSGDILRVRSERSARGDGRVYRIAVTATDSHGASCTGTATVAVPRFRNRAAVDSAPPSYDSLGS